MTTVGLECALGQLPWSSWHTVNSHSSLPCSNLFVYPLPQISWFIIVVLLGCFDVCSILLNRQSRCWCFESKGWSLILLRFCYTWCLCILYIESLQFWFLRHPHKLFLISFYSFVGMIILLPWRWNDDDPAVVNVGQKTNGVSSMDLMNGQSSNVNIAAIASEVRIARLVPFSDSRFTVITSIEI